MIMRKIIMSAALALALCILIQAGAVFAQDSNKGGTPGPTDLPAFLNGLGKKVSNFKTLKTDFTQEKELAIFKNKIILKGRIYLQKPGMLAWHVDKPIKYSVVITDKLIRQWDEETNQVQEIALAKNPVLKNILNQITVWFLGDYSSLLEYNNVQVLQKSPLIIEFTPKETNIAKKVIKGIAVTFREDEKYLKQIKIQENSGDVTTIIFMNTVLDAPVDSRSFEVKGGA
ncbi:MAG: outer membrane lipoprotein carrier protein LolA [Nitrospirae bacterium]|nr:MAG: outer membrane lipoprotein carrier protein LolA [Nitrospirota bacterium]